ncbi:RecX family transcriptional regulator [Sphingomonas flavalba]|uniref:RecX family transcriptional regulator n=1 Tax=Sphingomonas flavalba TaxID=2559804 RepID=UPI0039E02476
MDATVAQSWRMRPRPGHSTAPPLDDDSLSRLALGYVGRYATTRARLAAYLERKLTQRGWAGEGDPPVAALVARFADLGYVDDLAYANARAMALQRRGYGERRISVALRVAGIADADRVSVEDSAKAGGWAAALAFARRRRFGPFAPRPPDRAARQRAIAAMLRAGHPFEFVIRIVEWPFGTVPDEDG